MISLSFPLTAFRLVSTDDYWQCRRLRYIDAAAAAAVLKEYHSRIGNHRMLYCVRLSFPMCYRLHRPRLAIRTVGNHRQIYADAKLVRLSSGERDIIKEKEMHAIKIRSLIPQFK